MSASSPSETPLADLRDEALRVLHAAEEGGVALRVMGGVAVALRCPSTSKPPLHREYKDLDLMGRSKERGKIDALLKRHGYEAEEQFNLLHGRHRLLYRDRTNRRQLDVLLERFEMSHTLELGDRIALDEQTLTPADLLLTKLQVVETNERDLKDAVALLLDCQIDDERVAKVLAEDWGWWRTATEVLDKVEGYAVSVPGFDGAERVHERIGALRERIEAEPKSLRWKTRAKVGDRMRWYELPEEEEEF